MALVAIVCSGCAHCGFVPVGALGRVLRCHDCGHASMVRKGVTTIGARLSEDDSDVDPWCYDAPLHQHQAPARSQPKRHKKRKLRRGFVAEAV
jgi:hypothetical protein